MLVNAKIYINDSLVIEADEFSAQTDSVPYIFGPGEYWKLWDHIGYWITLPNDAMNMLPTYEVGNYKFTDPRR